ncbi:MAG: HD-GYP domain-containing protein [Oscillospiraceae bacterium]
MEILQTCKMQIACLLLLLYVGSLFIFEGNKLGERMGKELCNKYYDRLFIIGELCVLFDGATAYTVNHIEKTGIINDIVHLIFLTLFEAFICELFIYWADVTGVKLKKRRMKFWCILPAVISACVTVFTMPTIYYVQGVYSNYSMGIPVYSTYICIALYSMLTVWVFLRKSAYIEKRKKTGFFMAMVTVIVITVLQLFVHESLFAALAVVLILISIYLVMENPTLIEAHEYHNEMIMGFATLIENKDNNTGGHIRRTSIYAEKIAKQLRRDERYARYITKDFMENLKKAAPMHDIGKISIPDYILQKPGRLTNEEYEIMKTHSATGGKIITETFGHLMDDDYKEMAYQVAYYHHEKYNGKGYPDGLKGTDIPLCARIMAVADVFDAVSSNRCYRDAMPLEICFNIIEKGRGEDFDPDIVDAFMTCRSDIERIAKELNSDVRVKVG